MLLTKGPWVSSVQPPSQPQAPPPVPPRPSSASSSGGNTVPGRPLPQPRAVPNQYVPNQYTPTPFAPEDAIYEAHEVDGVGFGGRLPPPPITTPSAVDLGPVEGQEWYWGNISRYVCMCSLGWETTSHPVVKDFKGTGLVLWQMGYFPCPCAVRWVWSGSYGVLFTVLGPKYPKKISV